MSRYVLSASARNDLDTIIDYLLEHATIEATINVSERLENTLDKISKNPEIGHLRSDLSDTPIRFWLVDSYLILYLSDVSPISVVRILHGRRDIKAIIGDF